MTAKDCILGRRSIRKFKADAVSHDLLSQIVETASYSPSWKHTQITRYIAVEGALKEKIAKECTSLYPPNGDIIAAAPVLMAVTIIKNRSGYERDGSFSTPRGDGELVALIPIGYPDETPVAPKRKPVEELLSYQS